MRDADQLGLPDWYTHSTLTPLASGRAVTWIPCRDPDGDPDIRSVHIDLNEYGEAMSVHRDEAVRLQQALRLHRSGRRFLREHGLEPVVA